jgi:hypothetical protein
MLRFVFTIGRLLEVYISNRHRYMSASDLEMVCYATQRIVKALPKAPYSQILEECWETALQGNDI